MRISAADLAKHVRDDDPPPPPIEPRLSPEEECALLTGRRPDDGTRRAREARVAVLVQRVARPTPDDASLLVLLAHHGALPVTTDDMRRRARIRLADCARLDPPPTAVVEVARRRRVDLDDPGAFAEALLPARLGPTSFHESGAGMHGGGTH